MDNSGLKILCSRKKKRNYLVLCAGIMVFLTIALFFISDRSLAQGANVQGPCGCITRYSDGCAAAG